MEDFVPYELAKKLEEKGFKTENTDWCYLDGNLVQVKKYVNISPYKYAPTIFQVLKWLREVKKIFICIDLLESGYCYDIQKNVVINNAEFDFDLVMLMTGCYETYELAAIAGIEYVIDNLI